MRHVFGSRLKLGTRDMSIVTMPPVNPDTPKQNIRVAI
jgi:hypothetical protein